jgi:carbon monoxide dehydrogenase subunit G
VIETQQGVTVDCDIDSTWAYAKNFERWASVMPGYQTCEIEDENNSRWILKIGVGAMVRTVKVRVHVEEWAGPQRVDFSFQLEADPVVGRGSYLAAPKGPSQTDLTLRVQVEGSGPMAPMWEAMGGPLLPKFAKSFAEQLKARIEECNGAGSAVAVSTRPKPSGFAAVIAWLRAVWNAVSGGRARYQV